MNFPFYFHPNEVKHHYGIIDDKFSQNSPMPWRWSNVFNHVKRFIANNERVLRLQNWWNRVNLDTFFSLFSMGSLYGAVVWYKDKRQTWNVESNCKRVYHHICESQINVAEEKIKAVVAKWKPNNYDAADQEIQRRTLVQRIVSVDDRNGNLNEPLFIDSSDMLSNASRVYRYGKPWAKAFIIHGLLRTRYGTDNEFIQDLITCEHEKNCQLQVDTSYLGIQFLEHHKNCIARLAGGTRP